MAATALYKAVLLEVAPERPRGHADLVVAHWALLDVSEVLRSSSDAGTSDIASAVRDNGPASEALLAARPRRLCVYCSKPLEDASFVERLDVIRLDAPLPHCSIGVCLTVAPHCGTGLCELAAVKGLEDAGAGGSLNPDWTRVQRPIDHGNVWIRRTRFSVVRAVTRGPDGTLQFEIEEAALEIDAVMDGSRYSHVAMEDSKERSRRNVAELAKCIPELKEEFARRNPRPCSWCHAAAGSTFFVKDTGSAICVAPLCLPCHTLFDESTARDAKIRLKRAVRAGDLGLACESCGMGRGRRSR